MPRLSERIAEARDAISALRSTDDPDEKAEQFAATFETCCATARQFLAEQDEGNEPDVIEASLRAGLLQDEEADEARRAARDHGVARSPVQRLGKWDLPHRLDRYGDLLDRWVTRMGQRAEH